MSRYSAFPLCVTGRAEPFFCRLTEFSRPECMFGQGPDRRRQNEVATGTIIQGELTEGHELDREWKVARWLGDGYRRSKRRGCWLSLNEETSTTLADFERHGIPKSVFL